MSVLSNVKEKVAALRKRHGVAHVLDAYALMTRNNASQYAGAITYFSFLALFPLLLVAVAVVGFVLASQPHLQTELFKQVTDKVPGTFGSTLTDSIQTAIDNRGSVGAIGLAGALLTGLGWISNLRQAIDAVWGVHPHKRNFVMQRVVSLFVLGGLGLGIVASVGLTAVATSATTQILSAVGLDSVPGASYLLKVLGIAIAAGGDMIIFWWVLIRLPQATPARRTMLEGVLMASVGFEILKIVGTYTIAHATANTTTAGPFAAIIAILVWIQLVCRFMLFCCAWMATDDVDVRGANSIPVIEPAVMAEQPGHEGSVSPAAVGATLVGAGALAGAVATWAATRPRPGQPRV